MNTITRVIGTAAMTAALGLGVSALPASAAAPASASVSSNQNWSDHNNDHRRCDRGDRWDSSHWNWWDRCDNRDHRFDHRFDHRW